MHRYRRRGAFRVPSQHVLHDLVARERLAGMARQELAHVELGLRQRHGGLAHVRLARCEVETQRAERQRVLALAPLPPQVRRHLRAQLGRAEGLAQVVVRPQAQTVHGIVLGASRREEHDGRIHRAADGAAQLEPVRPRHHHVQQHQIVAVELQRQRLLGACGAAHVVPVLAQHASQQVADRLVVVDREYAGHRSSFRLARV